MVLKLHGMNVSTCTRTVAVTLMEKKVPFEFVPVDIFKGEQKQSPHLKNQPFGVVPFIDDDGFILFESRAIARYIAAKYASQGTPLIPTDLKDKALFEQAASIEISYYDPHIRGAVAEAVFKKFRGLEPNQSVVDEHVKNLTAKLEVYDQILAKQKYLAGDNITLADLFHLSYGTEFERAGFETLSKFPNVARWWKDISTRPAWLAVKDGVTSHLEA